jgi:mannose-1-phosphate guanylyltransferase
MRGGDYNPSSDWSSRYACVRGVVLAGRADWGRSAEGAALRDPLAPVALSPLIGFPLRWLRDGGVLNAAICASGPRMPAVREHLGTGAAFGMSVVHYDDRSPRGAAGCVRDAVELVCGGAPAPSDTFVVVEGALIPSVDLSELLRAHWHSEAAATIVVEVDRRRSIAAGPRPNVPGGIYVFDARAVAAIAATGYHDIKQGLIERLYRAGERVAVHRVQGLSPRVIDHHSYLAVNRWIVDRTAKQELDGYVRIDDSLCHHTARVHRGASLVGPVIVGPGTVLDEDVVVIGPTAIGMRCRLEPGAVVTRSVVWDDCAIERDAVIDSSVLVSGAVVAADRYLCGGVEMPASAPAPAPGGDHVSPLWRLPSLPHTPLRSMPAVPASPATVASPARRRA